jgi:hypothetical protein
VTAPTPSPERCDQHFARHPDRPHLVAVCTLPPDHDGDHDNRLAAHYYADTTGEPQ